MQLILNKAAQTAPAGRLAEWRSPALDEVAFKLVTLGTSSGDQDDTGPQANQVSVTAQRLVASTPGCQIFVLNTHDKKTISVCIKG